MTNEAEHKGPAGQKIEEHAQELHRSVLALSESLTEVFDALRATTATLEGAGPYLATDPDTRERFAEGVRRETMNALVQIGVILSRAGELAATARNLRRLERSATAG